jgi:hypothetical protein
MNEVLQVLMIYRSLPQQYRQRLLIRLLRPFLQFRQRTTAYRMPHHQERIRRQPHDPGNIPSRYLERFGAHHHRPFAKLFETDAVMQTARRARASIAKPGNQKIHLARRLSQHPGRCRSTRVRLRIHWAHDAAMPRHEQSSELTQHFHRVQLVVFQDADGPAQPRGQRR